MKRGQKKGGKWYALEKSIDKYIKSGKLRTDNRQNRDSK